VTKIFTSGISAGTTAFTATVGSTNGVSIAMASTTAGSPTTLDLVANLGTACADLTDGCCAAGNFNAGIAITRNTVRFGASSNFAPSGINTIYVANTCDTGLVRAITRRAFNACRLLPDMACPATALSNTEASFLSTTVDSRLTLCRSAQVFPITNGATPTVGAVIPIGTSKGNLQAIAADRTSNIWLAGSSYTGTVASNDVYFIASGTATVSPVTVTLAEGATILTGMLPI
jgi:hypothetical protein